MLEKKIMDFFEMTCFEAVGFPSVNEFNFQKVVKWQNFKFHSLKSESWNIIRMIGSPGNSPKSFGLHNLASQKTEQEKANVNNKKIIFSMCFEK